MKLEQKKRPVAAFAAFSFAVFMITAVCVQEYQVEPATMFALIATSVVAGVVATVGLVEQVIGSSMEGYRAVHWAAAGALALLVYLCRVAAINEVNGIFHIDASALPLTVIAGTTMQVAAKLKGVALVVGCISLLVFIVMLTGKWFDEHAGDLKKFLDGVIAIASALSFFILFGMIQGRLNDEARLHKLYRIAHATDFSGAFRCHGVDEKKNDVLFLGPDQRRVLVAPKVPPPSFLESTPELLLPVSIPKEFVVQECLPPPLQPTES